MPKNSDRIEQNVPLENLEAEQLVLGSLLLRNGGLAKIPDLQPGHFVEPVHQRLFSAIRAAWQEGQLANPVTLKAAFDSDADLKALGGAQYLARIAACAGFAVSVVDYATALIDLHGRRELARICAETLAALEFGTVITNPVVGMAAAVAAAADGVINQQSGNRIKTCAEIVDQMIAESSKIGEPISTGYARMDEAMDGGMLRGKLYAFMARQKTGKTMVLGSLALNLALAGHKTLFIAAEMGAQEIELRNLARVTHQTQPELRKGAREDEETQQRMRNWAAKMQDHLLYASEPSLTLSRLKTLIESAVYLYRIEAVVLDYWQLVSADDPRRGKTQHLDEVAQWLAAVAKRHNIVVIVAGQTNRDGKMRDGDGLANACDLCLEICRPDDYTSRDRWLEMRQSRYTRWRDVGDEKDPSYRITENGSHMEELPA